ncbi:MAG: hypothetical protein DI606_11265 [Sphingobium sp.]|jgi:hypothetical protein|uniref:hypothetical protein n=1 Tax=Sphingobium sp. TaxID=1912891 RepID=UPI000DB04FE4|nr:hypothetical protein [Sphingobium sp.]PZU11322.1 MAG: hypothetical protein DI606_11265 [Sphingobium sp.]
MSRAINIQATPDAIRSVCSNHSFRISVLEPLNSGGVRVVMLDPKEADALRILMKGKLIEGVVKRSPSHVARQPAATTRR